MKPNKVNNNGWKFTSIFSNHNFQMVIILIPKIVYTFPCEIFDKDCKEIYNYMTIIE